MLNYYGPTSQKIKLQLIKIFMQRKLVGSFYVDMSVIRNFSLQANASFSVNRITIVA